MKTDIAEHAGKHAFEVAGLGKAPFRFVGASDNVITYPDGTQKAGGTCDYCSTGIRLECRCVSADGKTFVVGCNCIAKVGDAGLLKAYKQSPEFRAHQRQLRWKAAEAIRVQLSELIAANKERLTAMPHPMGFTDRKTGTPLTALEYAEWNFNNCGAKGRKWLIGKLRSMLT